MSPESEKFKKLRKKAEKSLQVRPVENESVDLNEAKKLLHELRVHQLELEMQNDELKQTYKELEKAKDRYVYLFDNAPTGYVIVNSAGIIKQANKTFADMIGQDLLNLKEKYFTTLIAEEHLAHFVSRFKAFFKQPDHKTIDLQLTLKKNPPVWVSLEANRPVDQNHYFDEENLLLSVVDINQRKADEEQIERSLKEKTTLLQEIHHRVKNNMQVISSILSLQKLSTEDENARTVLRDSQMRVQAMAFIHESLYNADNLHEVNLQHHLGRLVSNIQSHYSNIDSPINIEIQIEQITIDVKQATPLGMIINELVSNCFKHAFHKDRSREVKIELIRKKGNVINLIVADNGIGVPHDFSLERSANLGLRLVKILVEEQLDGILTVTGNEGARFDIQFKDMRSENPEW